MTINQDIKTFLHENKSFIFIISYLCYNERTKNALHNVR